MMVSDVRLSHEHCTVLFCWPAAEVPIFSGTGTEGIYGQRYVIWRTYLCNKVVVEMLYKKGYVLILAPPHSGKTGLLQVRALHASTMYRFDQHDAAICHSV